MTVNVPLVVALLAAVVAAPLPDGAVVVTILLARMNAVTETTIAATAVTAPVAQMIGQYPNASNPNTYTHKLRDRDNKREDDRDDGRENGTNGDDRKGDFTLPGRPR